MTTAQKALLPLILALLPGCLSNEQGKVAQGDLGSVLRDPTTPRTAPKDRVPDAVSDTTASNNNTQQSGNGVAISKLAEEMTALKAQIGSVNTDVAAFKTQMGDVSTKVTGVESKIGTVETKITGAETHIGAVENSVKAELTGIKGDVTGVVAGVSHVTKQVEDLTTNTNVGGSHNTVTTEAIGANTLKVLQDANNAHIEQLELVGKYGAGTLGLLSALICYLFKKSRDREKVRHQETITKHNQEKKDLISDHAQEKAQLLAAITQKT